MPHQFRRQDVAFARQKAREHGCGYFMREPVKLDAAYWRDLHSNPSRISAPCPPAWDVATVLATDHEALEEAGTEILRALHLLDDMTGSCCPVCGGRDLNLGNVVTPLLVMAMGQRRIGFKHTNGCPLYLAWRRLTLVLEGMDAAEHLNAVTARRTV